MSGLLYEVSRTRTEDLLREGERQRLASDVGPDEPATTPAEPRRSQRVVVWPFRQVARVARLARAGSVS